MELIKKSFDTSPARMLSMKEFMTVSGFELNEVFVDRFYHNLKSNMKLYISEQELEYIGYSGELKIQKQRFKEALKNNFVKGRDYWVFNNSEYEIYYNEVNGYLETNIPSSLDRTRNIEFEVDTITIDKLYYPNPSEFSANGKNNNGHLIVTTRCYKEVIMSSNTTKARAVRGMYMDLEEFYKLYGDYQMYFGQNCISKLDALLSETKASREEHKVAMTKSEENNKKLLTILTEMKGEQEAQTEILEEVSYKLNVATDERAPRTQSEETHPRFILVELNDPSSPYEYYVIRTQKKYVKSAYSKLKAKHKNAKAKIIIKYQPNAVNLFNLIKEELRDAKKVVSIVSNYIRLKSGYTKSQFTADVEEINQSKKNIEVAPESDTSST